MTFSRDSHATGPARPGGFPTGLKIRAHGGRFDGLSGVVVDHTPDHRPGSVWIEFDPGQTRLVPGYRLDVVDTSED